MHGTPVFSEVRTRSQHSRVRDGRGHFHAGIFARAHGGDGHPGVPVPGRRDDHRVQVLPAQQLLPHRLAAGIDLRAMAGLLLDPLRRVSGAVGYQVANGGELRLRELEQRAEQAVAARAGADQTQADGFGLLLCAHAAGSQGGSGGCGGLEEGAAVHAEAVVHAPAISARAGQVHRFLPAQGRLPGPRHRRSGYAARRWRSWLASIQYFLNRPTRAVSSSIECGLAIYQLAPSS